MFPSDFLISLQSPLHPQNGNEHLSIIVQNLIRCDCEGGDISIILHHHIFILWYKEDRLYKCIFYVMGFLLLFICSNSFTVTSGKINIRCCTGTEWFAMLCQVTILRDILCQSLAAGLGWRVVRRLVSWLGLLPWDWDTGRESASISFTVIPSPANKLGPELLHPRLKESAWL